MTKRILLLSLCVIFIIILYWYSEKITKPETTNLSNIFIDNIALGNDIKNVNLTKYTKTNKYDEIYTYGFNEIAINVNNDIIDGLFCRFIENSTIISINENINLVKITNIEDILGNNYKDKWYDKEQGLRTHIYYDYDNNIKADFIYSNYDNNLIWIKLKNTN